MDAFPLGGFSVNRLGFGAMQLPGPNAFGPPRDRDEALAVLRRAIELGVNHVDTSQFYGPDVANELIRTALHPYPQDLALVSKVGGCRDDSGAWLPAGAPDQLRRDIETNLRSLGVDQLAVVNLRVFESDGPDREFDDQLSAMIEARDQGLIGGIGLSNVNREHLLHAVGRTEIACVQNAFNLVHRESAPVLEECEARGIAFVPFFPLGGGDIIGTRELLEREAIRAVAARHGATPAQVALAWMLSQGTHVLAIPGTGSVAHLEENVGAAGVELDAEDLSVLEA
jgi:pyridoxine 4-dehydrogenase